MSLTAPLSPHDVIVGIDVGGTKVQAAAFDRGFQQLAELRVPTEADSPEAVAALVVEAVAALQPQLGDGTLAGIGVGIPGIVDRQTGSVRQAVNLGIGADPLELGYRMRAAYNVPCQVDNDVNAAALGAFRLLRAEDIADLVYLSIGTGIAAGAVLNGRLHQGRRGVAGEIGHFPVTADGPICECGLQGCLETVASGAAIGRQWPVADGGQPAQSLLSHAAKGDERARAVLDPIADHLARAVYLLAITYDPDCIVIGGGVADVGRPLIDAIDQALERMAVQSGFVRSLELPTRLLLKPSGPVGAVGAAALAHPEHRR